MTLRGAFRPLRPDLDNFLFTPIGDERDGVPLSMLSALTRLGLDPWDEAGRLSLMSKREAGEQLARLLAELPGASRTLAEGCAIAGEFIERLPIYGNGASPPVELERRWTGRWLTIPSPSQFFVISTVIAAAAFLGLFGYMVVFRWAAMSF